LISRYDSLHRVSDKVDAECRGAVFGATVLVVSEAKAWHEYI